MFSEVNCLVLVVDVVAFLFLYCYLFVAFAQGDRMGQCILFFLFLLGYLRKKKSFFLFFPWVTSILFRWFLFLLYIDKRFAVGFAMWCKSRCA